MTLLYIGLAIQLGAWWFLIGAPFIVYPFAWSGHFFFEKNTPAAWTNPIKAKVCDWKMTWDTLTGKLEW